MPAPTQRSVDQIKKGILRPALTSHYDVFVTPPEKIFNYLKQNGVNWGSQDQDNLSLACCEALLPGSNLATAEINSDYTGVTERHVHRRVYDDRIDLTFYVQADTRSPYNAIKFFETWIKYTTNESRDGKNSITRGNFFYQVKYPKEYYGQLEINKFERDYYNKNPSKLTYKFVNVYPISLASMPISYETANLLKVTVSLSYIRYYLEDQPGESDKEVQNNPQNFNLSPQQLANINKVAFNPNINLGLNYGEYATTGGVNFDSSAATGNAINVKDAYGGNYTLNLK